jgi:hypothetical protein
MFPAFRTHTTNAASWLKNRQGQTLGSVPAKIKPTGPSSVQEYHADLATGVTPGI